MTAGIIKKNRHPYEGRWIARIGQNIISQGGSFTQAQSSAGFIRSKETVIIAYIPMDMTMGFHPLFDQVRGILHGYVNVYLVGGAVRDALLGKKGADLDFTVAGGAEQPARLVANQLGADYYIMDRERDAHRVIVRPVEIGEITYLDFIGMHGSTIDDDLRQRDFTVNAMAVNIHDPQKLIDPMGGSQDLRNGLIRSCGMHALEDDPVRTIRAIRFAAELGCKLEESTRGQVKAAVGRLNQVSPERSRDELFKILQLERLPQALNVICWLGILQKLFPELSSRADVSQKDAVKNSFPAVGNFITLVDTINRKQDPEAPGTLASGMAGSVLGGFRQQLKAYLNHHLTPDRDIRQLILFSLVLESTGELLLSDRLQEQILRRINLSREEIELCTLARQPAARDLLLSNRAIDARMIHRFFRDYGDKGVAATLFALAGLPGDAEGEFTPESWKHVLENTHALWDGWWNRRETAVNPRLLMDGNDIVKLTGISPGPHVGRLIRILKEEQAAGHISTREEACDLVKMLASEQDQG